MVESRKVSFEMDPMRWDESEGGGEVRNWGNEGRETQA